MQWGKGSRARRVLLGSGVIAGAFAFTACANGDPASTLSSSSSGGAGGNASSGTTTSDIAGSTAAAGPLPLPTGRFRISAWCGPPEGQLTPERMSEMANAGFTTANVGCEGNTMTVDYNKTMISLANAEGMDASVWDLRIYDAVNNAHDIDNNLDAAVADYASLPGMGGYFVIDEPAGPFDTVAQVVKGLQDRDPAHFAHVNLLPVYASTAQLGFASYSDYVATYFAQAQPRVASFDDYPFLTNGNDTTFFVDLETMRTNAVANDVPFWQFVQSSAFAGHRTTNRSEKLWEGTQTLAYGGAGIAYFTYWTLAPHWGFQPAVIDYAGNQTPQYEEAKYINARLQAYGRYLVAAKSKAVFHNGALPAGTVTRVPGSSVYVPNAIPITVGLFDVNDDEYGFLANRDYNNAIETDVWLASNGTPEILDVETGEFGPLTVLETDPIKGQRVHLSIEAADGALLHLIGPVPVGAPGAEAFVGTVRGDTNTYDMVDSSYGDSYSTQVWWNTCPEGYTYAGGYTSDQGFWVCTRNDLQDRTFYLGNVVSDQAMVYKLQGGGATANGAESWDTCPAGSLIGHRFESNGFWLCLD